MDIETTGLSRKKDTIYLVGILYFKKGWYLDQYFLNTLENEKLLLKEVINRLNNFKKIITYNGESFDLPFINTRARKYTLEESIDLDKSLDLYRLIKKDKDILNLKNLKLKTIEESLGYFREDIYSGYDCIAFYKDFIVNSSLDKKEIVLRHNFDDLVHMLDIIKILDIIDEKKTIDLGEISLLIKEVGLSEDKLNLKGIIKGNLDIDLVNYSNNFGFVTREQKYFDMYLETNKAYIDEDTICVFINLKDYDLKPREAENLGLPDFIYPIKIGKNLLFNNIKNLSYEFLVNKIL